MIPYPLASHPNKDALDKLRPPLFGFYREYDRFSAGVDDGGWTFRIEWMDRKTGRFVGLKKFRDSDLCLVVVESELGNEHNDLDIVPDDQVGNFILSRLGG